ncbi:MAG: c-type cytochrome [Bacteroidetes bacterium]|nr:c-type cytochrome [Bacteroidota bacterium]
MNAILSDSFYLALLLVIAVLLICLTILYSVFKSVFKTLYPDAIKEKAPKKTATVYEQLTAYVPIEEEHTILMDHEYDGIRELDNNLPPWWVYMFYACILFAVAYFGYYQVMGGPSQKQEYETELAEFKAAREVKKKASNEKSVDENTVVLLTDAASISFGKSLFEGNCKTCHGDAGKGLNGPNLADEYWLYGGSVKDIFSTAKYGKIEKGMPAWGMLGGKKLEAIVSYIKQLQPAPDGKAPQGNKYVEEVVAVDSTATLPVDSIKK